MATRRSKLRVMPNIGPKISKTPSKPAEAKKPTTPASSAVPKPSAEKPVLKEKTLPVLQDSVEKKNSEEPFGLMEKGSVMLKDVEMTKSPVKPENDKVNSGLKPDTGPLRAARNRLPKPKPNITSVRGAAPRPKVNSGSTSPVKVFSPDRQPIKSPVKSPVAGLLAEDSSTQQSLPSPVESCEQDENVPVTMETVDSVDSSTAGLVKPSPVKYDKLTSYKAEKTRPSRKQRTANMKQFPEDAPPDRQRMKMVDMIYWNPTNNPMKQSTEKVRRQSESITVDTNSASANSSITQTEDDTVDNNDESSNSNDAGLVPQVTIGPDGSMIINEQSLVVETEQEKETLSPTEIVEEDDMFVNYNSFRNKTATKTWHDNETARFYRALSALGTDFSLMSNLFPHRTRRELKNKFKREEKFNRGMVDKAMSLRIPFSLDSFESIESVLEKDKQEREARRKASHKRKKTEKQADSVENKAKKSKTIVDSDSDEGMPEYVGPNPKPKSKSKQPSPTAKVVKPKSTKEKRAKKKTVKDDQEVQQSNSTVNEIEEYRFESSDEDDQVPSRLPKLKKSANFTEFHNTAAQKLQESFGTRPPSEDDDNDEDDEEEDVDVLASDSDMEDNANNVLNSKENDNVNNKNDNDTNNANNVLYSKENDNVNNKNDTDCVTISESQAVTNLVNDNENVNDIEQIIEKSPETLTFEAIPEVASQEEETDSSLTCIKEKPQSKPAIVNDKNSEKISPVQDQTHSDIVNSSSIIQNTETDSTSKSTIAPPKEKSQPTRAPVRRLKKFQPNLNLARKKTNVGASGVKNSPKAVAGKKVEISKKVTETKKQMNNASKQEKSSENTKMRDQGQKDIAEMKNQITETPQATNTVEVTGSPVSAILDLNDTPVLATQFSCDVVDIDMGDISTSDLSIGYSEEEIVTLDSSVLPVQNVEVLEKDNTDHFVLPANVFPNMPFTQDGDKMQMVLVPETKNGDTIYHVYMVPENSKSSEGQTILGSTSEESS